MKCNQCDRPAFYNLDSIGLCVHCYKIVAEISARQTDTTYKEFLMNSAMLNQAEDYMDAAAGIQFSGNRIPVSELAKVLHSKNFNNTVTISNSNVGVVNTGDLAKINASINISQGSDVADFAVLLKAFTEEIVRSSDVSSPNKKELVELLGGLAEQVAGNRSIAVMKSILAGVEDLVRPTMVLFELYEKLKETLAFLLG